MGKTAILVGVLLAAAPDVPCKVPVFRYALERWPSDVHRLVITGAGGPAEPAWGTGHHANVVVRRKESGGPLRYEVRYAGSDVAWYEGSDVPLNRLVDSPLRRKIAHELLTGTAAAWLLLEGRNAEANDAAFAMLRRQLDEVTRLAELPELPDFDENSGLAVPGGPLSAVPLAARFSARRLARDDRTEEFLVRQITGLDPSFEDDAAPIAVAIFGRGRALPVPSDRLVPASIAELCDFLCSPCSCRAKTLNPGIDLLFCANWEQALVRYPATAPTLLPDGRTLQLGGRAAPEPELQAPAEAVSGAGEAPGPSGQVGTAAITTVLALALLAAVGFVLVRRPRA